MEISSREWAILILTGIFVLYCIFSAQVRPALLDLLRTAIHHKILLMLLLFTSWICTCVYILHKLSLWEFDNLKTTCFWLTLALPTSFKASVQNKAPRTHIRDAVPKYFCIPVIIPFIANYYTFNIVSEIIIVTASIFLVFAIYVAESKNINGLAVRIINIILFTIFAITISNSSHYIITHPDEFFTKHTILDFIIPILLSALLIPFTILLSALLTYVSRYIVIKHFVPNEELHTYALMKAIINFGFNFEKLQKWSLRIIEIRPTQRAEIDQAIKDIMRQAPIK